MKYKVQYGDNFIELSDFQKPDNVLSPTEFTVKISSDGFCGAAPFETKNEAFEKFVSDIKEMYNFKTETAVLCDMYIGSKLDLKMDNVGHIRVSGRLYDLHKEQCLDFAFEADQTALCDFVKEKNYGKITSEFRN